TLRVAEARAASLKAQIEEARSTLAGDEANLGYTKIYAPMDGTVASQTAREGQTLNANQTAPVILQIADLGTMTVRAQVAEADVPRVQPGMDVSFTTLGSLNRRWQAVVRQILPTPEVINDVVLYNVLADVDNR
ncbi:MAG TPA: efflux RND transporter periplasmic adaptor subunit, partial [Gammaproteobacteria bacterium]|nr:efflux RND transporter periplasmic adaptor subunit [Gammaproteobacteria bacterium]